MIEVDYGDWWWDYRLLLRDIDALLDAVDAPKDKWRIGR